MLRVSKGLWLALSALVALSLGVAACSLVTPSSTGPTPAQVTADVQGAIQGLLNTLPALEASKPPVITHAQAVALQGDLQEALTLAQSVGPDTPAQTGTTTLARASGYLNSVLSVLITLPIPPPYNLIVIAASIVAPELEAYLTQVTTVPPGPVAAKLSMHASEHGMTLSRAREILKVPAQ